MRLSAWKRELGTFSFLPLCPLIAPSLKGSRWLWDLVSLWRMERAGLDISRRGQASQPLDRWEDRQGESDGVGGRAEEAGSRRKSPAFLQNCIHSRWAEPGLSYLPSEGHGNC